MSVGSYRRRLARRRAERAAKSGAVTPENATSSPGSPGSGEDYLSPAQANQIYGRMIRADRDVWPITEMHAKAAVGVCTRNMANEDGRVSNGAVRNLIAMQSQNIGHAETLIQNNVNVQAGPTVINVIEEVIDARSDISRPAANLPGAETVLSQ